MCEMSADTKTDSLKDKSPAGFYFRVRMAKDAMLRYGVVAGGLLVLSAILLILFYLLYVVLPLFSVTKVAPLAHYTTPEAEAGKSLLLLLDAQNQVATRFTSGGRIVFFAAATGKVLSASDIALPADAEIRSFALTNSNANIAVYGLSDGRAVIVKPIYSVSYAGGKRTVTPALEYPWGSDPLVLDKDNNALEKLAVGTDETSTTLVAKTSADKIRMLSMVPKAAGDRYGFVQNAGMLDLQSAETDFVLIDSEQKSLYLAGNDGLLAVYDIEDKSRPVLKLQKRVVEPGRRMTALSFLSGEISLLIGDSTGTVAQWIGARDSRNRYVLRKLRDFTVSDNAIAALAVEQWRKGFAAVDEVGTLGFYYTTSSRELLNIRIGDTSPRAFALAPRANAFLLEARNDRLEFWRVDNPHPEVSFQSLWRKVWYESYPKPDYVWQSSSASNGFEPKYSMTPLLFGTLKAACYALLVAVPLALAGAVYTAHFMAPHMRRWVKPGIEIMEALPTVILGFLAGLWLAPLIETHLAGVFSALLLIPTGVLAFAYGWQFAPLKIRYAISEGWEAALLCPVIIIAAGLAFVLSSPIETWCFDGSLRHWLDTRLGIDYDQRNALVVGLAMGFAVIPTIFTIAEDAVFGVPEHLSVGSLALGATKWQTMTRVVLLTASPGIFSAVMIGLGRAVGETMIVLMATGNTPIMDFSIFEGMRTLSANIAVEMPEAEVDSTHYRLLFLTALILFVFTFAVNTVADLIRQNLRDKYGSL
ncbi:MAG: phosphate ABC transporter permease [Gammaproteobacteria bacterium]